jgi:hypothetical protein
VAPGSKSIWCSIPHIGGRPGGTSSRKTSSKSRNKSRTTLSNVEGKSLVEDRASLYMSTMNGAYMSTMNGAVVFLTSLRSLLLTNKHSLCCVALLYSMALL